MSAHAPLTIGNWTTFVDAWAQYHGVQMRPQAREALINACRNALEHTTAMPACAPGVTPVLISEPPPMPAKPGAQRVMRRPAAPSASQAAAAEAEREGTDPYLAGIAARSEQEPTVPPRARIVRRPTR